MNVRTIIAANPALVGATLSRRRVLGGLVGLVAAATVAPRISWAQSTTPSAATPAASDGTWAPWTKYNLNLITSEQILTIPGAGDKMTRVPGISPLHDHRPVQAGDRQVRRR